MSSLCLLADVPLQRAFGARDIAGLIFIGTAITYIWLRFRSLRYPPRRGSLLVAPGPTGWRDRPQRSATTPHAFKNGDARACCRAVPPLRSGHLFALPAAA